MRDPAGSGGKLPSTGRPDTASFLLCAPSLSARLCLPSFKRSVTAALKLRPSLLFALSTGECGWGGRGRGLLAPGAQSCRGSGAVSVLPRGGQVPRPVTAWVRPVSTYWESNFANAYGELKNGPCTSAQQVNVCDIRLSQRETVSRAGTRGCDNSTDGNSKIRVSISSVPSAVAGKRPVSSHL